MTIVKTILASGIIFLTAISGEASAAPDKGFYYLICRGGGAMNPIIQPQENSTQIIINFRASRAGWKAGPPPNPGECTWVDRALSSSEPKKLRFDIPADVEETNNWRANPAALFFPFQRPVKRNVNRKITRVAVQVRPRNSGFSLRLLRPNAGGQSRPYQAITSLDFSQDDLLTFSVKSIDSVLVANRVTKGVVTGDAIDIRSGDVQVR